VDAHDEKIIRFFRELRADRMELVDGFYHSDVVFEDPVGRVEGREALRRYYEGLYANVTSIDFEFSELVGSGDHRAGTWTMTLAAKKLDGGKPFSVPGMSLFHFDPASGLVAYHRDYFDLGAFIYERIPILRGIVRTIRRRLASH
jgi:ketosteroid isomerase-like protein